MENSGQDKQKAEDDVEKDVKATIPLLQEDGKRGADEGQDDQNDASTVNRHILDAAPNSALNQSETQ
jgi:hypothetical protein